MGGFEEREIEFSLRELETIFSTGVLDDQSNPLLVAAITRCLICLNDLLNKAASKGCRVDIRDHVITSEKIQDLTDLIREVRNACCHIGSRLHRSGRWNIQWNIVSGVGRVATVDGITFACEFEDEIAIFFGDLRLYVRRNLQRAFDEIAKKFSDQRWV